MRDPQQGQKDEQVLVPLIPSKFLKYISDFYQKLHDLDHQYSNYLYSKIQQYTLLSFFSKAIGLISDGPALPLFLFWYGYNNLPSPFTYIAYCVFFILFHELSIKGIFKRRRPLSAGTKKGFSFPSSHAFTSALIITSTLFLPFPFKAAIYVFGILNALNRPLLGVHYISDVVMGVSLGAFVGGGWIYILSRAFGLP